MPTQSGRSNWVSVADKLAGIAMEFRKILIIFWGVLIIFWARCEYYVMIRVHTCIIVS